MPIYNKQVLALEPQQCAEHLVGKVLFRVLCCGSHLSLEDTRSTPGGPACSVGRVIFILKCPVCHRQLDVEVASQGKSAGYTEMFENLNFEM